MSSLADVCAWLMRSLSALIGVKFHSRTLAQCGSEKTAGVAVNRCGYRSSCQRCNVAGLAACMNYDRGVRIMNARARRQYPVGQ